MSSDAPQNVVQLSSGLGNQMPRYAIAVVIPVYNVVPYLRRCLDSVIVAAKEVLSPSDPQSATFDLRSSSVEIVCVDDGSTDGSGEVLDAYVRDFRSSASGIQPVLRVLRQSNAGLSAARNAALDVLVNEKTVTHVAFVDSDDWVAPCYLAELVRGLAGGAEISAVRCVRAADETVVWETSAAVWHAVAPRAFWAMTENNVSAAWGKLYPLALFEGIRYPVGKINEDEFTTYRLFFRAARVAYSDAAFYAYFIRPESIMNARWSIRRLDRLQAWRDQIRFFGKCGFAELVANSRRGLAADLVDAVRNLRQLGDVARAEACRRELADVLKAGGMSMKDNYLAYKTAWPMRTRLSRLMLKCLGIADKGGQG